MNANALKLAWLGPPISSLPPQYFPVPRITFVVFLRAFNIKMSRVPLRTFVGNQTTNVPF